MTDEARNLGNELAYPHAESEADYPMGYSQYGLTKREYFAAMSMQGLLANSAIDDWTIIECAKYSVKHADALLEELAKTNDT
jgi:hypothetical protein